MFFHRVRMILSPLATRGVGPLLVTITLLEIVREWHMGINIEALIDAATVLLLVIVSFQVSISRLAFILVAVVISVITVIVDPNWQASIERGLGIAAFIAAFFTALTTLRHAAQTSPTIQACGKFLASQPPGRRYAALTVGGQMFGLLLNYGSIALLGSLAVADSELEQNRDIRNHRIRRMLLAIQRGFISTLPWSPLSFAVAISTALVPGTSWAQSAPPGLVNGAIIALVGWALDTLFKPKLSAPPAYRKREGSWFSLLPLGLLLGIMVLLIGGMHFLTGIRVVGLVILIVPLISIVWIRLQSSSGEPLREVWHRTRTYVARDLLQYRSEMVLLTMAGYIGAVGSPLLVSVAGQFGFDLVGFPSWVILVSLVWFIPLVGQVGMNPILAVSLVAPLLPDAAGLGIAPTALVVAITAGWTLSGISSPYTATTLLIGHFAGISATRVGLRWNGFYTLTCGTLLSAWVVFYARQFT